MSRQVPNNTVALSSGVRLQDISLAETIEQTLYIQQPIDMVLVGGYHNLGLFLSGLAALPRLITIQGFAVTNSNPLIMDPQSLSLVLHTTAYQSMPSTSVDSNSDLEPPFLEREQ
ncbi:type 4a pilus biogenesis protein PilO [Psychrobacter sp. FDAARGOS_221]|uniref:type 4a pilus biogenesis protein PilO n=1 Tax=Psychrobacter sp. FDAARGOS_221 TaxID=1975705 RepID=UPI000BB56007|nr:type 4a pilus biogenesis protein PilO [Psychrobacter sp. FDAARGOS_221]PNK60359.1 hypothetical protein A6J60_005380 [Psychrobacter sp. FDAARGOS_221]